MPDARTTLTAILVNNEPQVKLQDLAREIGKHPCTLTRWIAKGIVLRDGTRVHLEAVRVGRELRTSRAAWVRFLAATSATLNAGSTPPAPTPTERRKSAEQAMRALEAMGA
jgi:hypothetical protein